MQHSCISDKNGQLQLSSNVDSLYDGEGIVIKSWNEMKALPNNRYRAECGNVLISPNPGNDSQYFIIRIGYLIENGFTPNKHQLTVYTYDAGRKRIVDSIVHPINAIMGDIKATLHANGQDYWVAITNYIERSISIYLLSNGGLAAIPSSKILIDSPVENLNNVFNIEHCNYEILFSPNGNYLAINYDHQRLARSPQQLNSISIEFI